MSKARNDYYTAVNTARTACGSCRSLNCKFCQQIIRLWRVYQAELLQK